MPDQLTQPPHPHSYPFGDGAQVATVSSRRRAGPVASLLQVLGVLVVFAAVAAGLGWCWEQWWQPSIGTVFRREWFPVDAEGRYDLAGLRNEFAGTAQYVVLALSGGLVLGGLSSVLLAGRELVALVAVLAASVLAAVVMWQVGTALGPPDPQVLALEAGRGATLPSDLSLDSLGALLAWPLASMLGMGSAYLVLPTPRARRR